MERVWVKSQDGKAVRQVAASAVPVMEVSGWKALTKTEVADHEKGLAKARDKRAAANAPTPEQNTPPARAAQDKEN